MAGWNKGNKGGFLPSRSLYLAREESMPAEQPESIPSAWATKQGSCRPQREGGMWGLWLIRKMWGPTGRACPYLFVIPIGTPKTFPFCPQSLTEAWRHGCRECHMVLGCWAIQNHSWHAELPYKERFGRLPFSLPFCLPFFSLSLFLSLLKAGRLWAVWAGMYLLCSEFQLFSTP